MFTDEFKKEEFLKPPHKNAPVYFWIWNGQIKKEKTDARLEEMHRLGVKGFYIVALPQTFRPTSMPTELEPEYLSDAYMEEIRHTVEKAKELNMTCWLYDEGGWPSGGVCGKLLLNHPEYARRTLGQREVLYKAGDIYKKTDSETVASFINDNVQIEEGYVFTEDIAVDEYFSQFNLFRYPGSADFPDITRREATDCFIEMTHEKYKEKIGEFFGNSVPVVFTDEPSIPSPFPFREELIDEYEKRYGESILPALPALFGKVAPDEKTAEMRIKWFDMINHMFCDNFLTPCREWSNKNNMKLTGHMNFDNSAMGSAKGVYIMRALRNLDIPGIDVIWRHIFPGEPGVTCAKGNEEYKPNNFFPRYASSAAAQNGGEAVMSESLAVYGNGVTFEQMRYVFGFQAVRGVNVFNPALFQYERKGGMMAGEHPAFREDQACHGDLKVFNEYLERLSYLVSVGKRVCDTALYFPIRDLWAGIDKEIIADAFEELGEKLEKLHIDFDIIDDDILESAKGLESGEISINNACYKRIVLPHCSFMSEKSKDVLEKFKANGGTVFEGIEGINSPEEITGDADGLILMKREAKGQTLYCIFNQGTKGKEYTLNLSGRKGFYINVTEGKTEPLCCEGDYVKVKLESGEVGGICLTDNEVLTDTINCKNRELLIDGKFDFKKLVSFHVGSMYAESIELSEKAVSVDLGEWPAGIEFSGSCLYEKDFSLPEICDDVILDLGDVRYTCEAILNGKSLGKKIMPPYRYVIDKEFLKEVNHLEIVVKNTPGNQFYHSDGLKIWPAWRTCPYFEIQKPFDEETLSSGLFGPIKILY